MKCDHCTKKATVHYTEIVNNKIVKMNLCEECAKEKGIGKDMNFSMTDLIGGLSSSGLVVDEKTECEYCGLSYVQFKEIGRFGCEGCYECFSSFLKSILETIHRSSKHIGKSPKGLCEERNYEIQLEQLHNLLEEVIDKEEFEEACRVRDQIKALKKNKAS